MIHQASAPAGPCRQTASSRLQRSWHVLPRGVRQRRSERSWTKLDIEATFTTASTVAARPTAPARMSRRSRATIICALWSNSFSIVTSSTRESPRQRSSRNPSRADPRAPGGGPPRRVTTCRQAAAEATSTTRLCRSLASGRERAAADRLRCRWTARHQHARQRAQTYMTRLTGCDQIGFAIGLPHWGAMDCHEEQL